MTKNNPLVTSPGEYTFRSNDEYIWNKALKTRSHTKNRGIAAIIANRLPRKSYDRLLIAINISQIVFARTKSVIKNPDQKCICIKGTKPPPMRVSSNKCIVKAAKFAQKRKVRISLLLFPIFFIPLLFLANGFVSA